MGMLKEFKEFAVKGNVVDMGIGIPIKAVRCGHCTSVLNPS